jgi:hypothetical protein
MEITNQKVVPTVTYVKFGKNEGKKNSIKIYIYAVALAALFSAVGVLWDISWHASIGRDQFLTPPHILIYLGAIFGGLFSAIQVLINTFGTPPEKKGSFVKVWGIFYASLGSLFCIWGAIAMLTSAPFDNWWHSAYGLDVKVFSPPHALLLLGIFFLEFGGCVSICKYLNLANPSDKSLRILRVLLVVASSSLLCLLYTISNPVIKIRYMRRDLFYVAVTAITLLILPALSRSMRMKWGMTAIAIGYFTLQATVNWVLQIFPAEPKLGPILTHITHFQPAMFPMLIMIPAVLMDLVLLKSKSSDWMKSFFMSAIFVLLIVAIQYPFSGFLLQSPKSRNWFFGGDAWFFGAPPNSPYRFKFSPTDIQTFPRFAIGIIGAIVIGTIISRISLLWGNWMLRIQR